jgi:hypothetical protein
VTHWADGGETKLDNLITLCGCHHRLVHERGYGLRRTDDGLFVFTRPDGSRVERNGAQRFSGNVGSGLRTHLRTLEPELSITAATARCRWLGETMDYSQAIEAMQFLQNKAAPPQRTA